jgi:plastocyanin
MTSPLHRLFLLLLCSSAAFAAEMISIPQWIIPGNGQPYPPEVVVVGDSVTFAWVGGNFHNVIFHPNGGCATDNTRVVIGTTSPTVYTFAEEDGSTEGKEMLLVCDVGGHCSSGMQVLFTVYSTEEDKPTDAAEEDELPDAESPVDAPSPVARTPYGTLPDNSGSSSVSFQRIQILVVSIVAGAAMLAVAM